MKTDCWGNICERKTPQGFCVRNIYLESCQWYNTKTGEHGNIVNGQFVVPVRVLPKPLKIVWD